MRVPNDDNASVVAAMEEEDVQILSEGPLLHPVPAHLLCHLPARVHQCHQVEAECHETGGYWVVGRETGLFIIINHASFLGQRDG